VALVDIGVLNCFVCCIAEHSIHKGTSQRICQPHL